MAEAPRAPRTRARRGGGDRPQARTLGFRRRRPAAGDRAPRVREAPHRSRSRRGFWRRFLPLSDDVGIDAVGEDGALPEEERRATERVSRALATLPPVQREAVVLFEIEGFSIEEIAALQGVTTSAVKSRLARGRARLRRHYERRHGRTGTARTPTGQHLVAEGETR